MIVRASQVRRNQRFLNICNGCSAHLFEETTGWCLNGTSGCCLTLVAKAECIGMLGATQVTAVLFCAPPPAGNTQRASAGLALHALSGPAAKGSAINANTAALICFALFFLRPSLLSHTASPPPSSSSSRLLAPAQPRAARAAALMVGSRTLRRSSAPSRKDN